MRWVESTDAGSHQASSLGDKDYKEPTSAFGHEILLRSTGTWYWMARMNTVVPVLPAMNTVIPCSVGILVNQKWSVVLSVNSLPDLCGYLWILFLSYEEENNTEQFLSYFWLFTSDFRYPLIFFTLFSNNGRLTEEKWICMKYRGTFFDHVLSVVLYILV